MVFPMIQHIHIFGASGSGVTTLGEALSARLSFPLFEVDNYFWLPTDPPFQEIREQNERIKLLQADLDRSAQWILTGSLCGWGDGFIPRFDLVIFLWIPPEIRLERLIRREKQRYSEQAIEPGGKLHQASTDFIEWAARYDAGDLTVRSKALHKKWMTQLKCPVLRLEGDLSVEERVGEVMKASQKTKATHPLGPPSLLR